MNPQIVTRQLVIVVTLIITFENTWTSGFLLASPGATLGYPTRNLSCPHFSSSGFHPTSVGVMNILKKGTDYCAVIEATFLNSSSSYNKTQVTSIVFLNEYWFMAVHQCGFSPSYDIGYGTCTRLPFETADIIKLCICTTTNCSISMAACQASVDQMMGSSTQPRRVPLLMSRFINRITCVNTFYSLKVRIEMTAAIIREETVLFVCFRMIISLQYFIGDAIVTRVLHSLMTQADILFIIRY